MLTPSAREQVIHWQAGFRSSRKPRNNQRQLEGPRALLRLQDRAQATSSTASAPQGQQHRSWWQNDEATIWPRSEPTEEETIDWGGGDDDDDEDEETPQEAASTEVALPWDERYGRGQPLNTFWENPSWQARSSVTLTPRTEPYAWTSYDSWAQR